MPEHSYEKIESATFDLEQMKKEYLRSRGWTDDSKYPGSYILWRHSESGLSGCTLDIAISLQNQISNHCAACGVEVDSDSDAYGDHWCAACGVEVDSDSDAYGDHWCVACDQAGATPNC